jgi:hypothetical protein
LDIHPKTETYQEQSENAWLDKKERKIRTKGTRETSNSAKTKTTTATSMSIG